MSSATPPNGHPAMPDALPVPIELDAKDAKMAKKLMEDAAALQAFMNQFMAVGQQKQAQLTDTQRQFWASMQEKHGIDISNVQWAPSDDGKTIVPVSVNLGHAQPAR